jgi:hypothetical protein
MKKQDHQPKFVGFENSDLTVNLRSLLRLSGKALHP